MTLQEDLRDRGLWAFALVLAVLVYGPELANFSLSIDEEVHSYAPDIWKNWASQGRWGMALLTYTLPPLWPLPFLAPLLFCLGLSVSALLLSRLVVRNRPEAFVFIGFFVSSPIWLHIGEFNTFSWGAGIALSAVALAARIAVGERKTDVVLAGLFAGFATGVYQGMVLLYALIVLVLCVRNRAFWGGCNIADGRRRLLLGPAISFVIAGAFYYCVNSLVLALLDEELGYVSGWVNLDQFFDSRFSAAASRTLQQVGGFLTGTDPTFLGWGAAILLLPWFGFAVGVRKVFDRRVDTFRWRLIGLISFGIAVAITFSLVVVSTGRIPTRALTTLPFFYSIMAVNAFRVRFGQGLRWAAFGYAMFVSLWISTALFYSDALARQRDSVLAGRFVNRVESVGRQKFGKLIPVVVVGAWSHEAKGPARQVAIFGESFFGHGGNSTRIGHYLRLQGLGDIKIANITRLQGKLDRINDMPSWPAAGSVAVVDDVVVVKMGPFSAQQSRKLGL